MFKNLKIGPKLLLGFAAVLALAIAALAFSIWRLSQVAGDTATMMEKPMEKERIVSDWTAATRATAQRTLAIARSADPSLATFFADIARQSSEESTKRQKAIGSCWSPIASAPFSMKLVRCARSIWQPAGP